MATTYGLTRRLTALELLADAAWRREVREQADALADALGLDREAFWAEAEPLVRLDARLRAEGWSERAILERLAAEAGVDPDELAVEAERLAERLGRHEGESPLSRDRDW